MANFLGLRTARYTARDLPAAKAWYAGVLGVSPYFDEPLENLLGVIEHPGFQAETA